MDLTNETLASIAEFKRVDDFGGRYGIETNIYPITDLISSNKRLELRHIEDGSRSKYYAFMVCEVANLGVEDAPCVIVQLSLLAPFGVLGLSSATITDGRMRWAQLSLKNVIDPSSSGNRLAQWVGAAVHSVSPYRLLPPEIVQKKAPAGIVICGDCPGGKPWDRVYHALFARYSEE